MVSNGKKDEKLGSYLNPTEALIVTMWMAQDAARNAEAKANTWLTIAVAGGSSMLGAGLGGFVTYWYSADTKYPLVIAAWFLAIIVAFALLCLVPGLLSTLRSRLYLAEGRELLADATRDGLIDAFVAGVVKRTLDLTEKKKSKRGRKRTPIGR